MLNGYWVLFAGAVLQSTHKYPHKRPESLVSACLEKHFCAMGVMIISRLGNPPPASVAENPESPLLSPSRASNF
jgi:hypothetical protein